MSSAAMRSKSTQVLRVVLQLTCDGRIGREPFPFPKIGFLRAVLAVYPRYDPAVRPLVRLTQPDVRRLHAGGCRRTFGGWRRLRSHRVLLLDEREATHPRHDVGSQTSLMFLVNPLKQRAIFRRHCRDSVRCLRIGAPFRQGNGSCPLSVRNEITGPMTIPGAPVAAARLQAMRHANSNAVIGSALVGERVHKRKHALCGAVEDIHEVQLHFQINYPVG